MGCGCAGVERAALTIAAAGGGAKILGPQGDHAVRCAGAALVLQGMAVECRGRDYSAVYCASKGRAELSGCTLTSPGGTGLHVDGGRGDSAARKVISQSVSQYQPLARGIRSQTRSRP